MRTVLIAIAHLGCGIGLMLWLAVQPNAEQAALVVAMVFWFGIGTGALWMSLPARRKPRGYVCRPGED